MSKVSVRDGFVVSVVGYIQAGLSVVNSKSSDGYSFLFSLNNGFLFVDNFKSSEKFVISGNLFFFNLFNVILEGNMLALNLNNLGG